VVRCNDGKKGLPFPAKEFNFNRLKVKGDGENEQERVLGFDVGDAPLHYGVFRICEAAAPVREQLKQMRQAMHAAVTSGTEQQIERIAQAQGALMAKAIVIHSKAMQEFYALLTPEQKQKAEKMRGLLRGFRAGPDPVQ